MAQQFQSFDDFYPYYLREHAHPICLRLHFIGTALVIVSALVVLVSAQWQWLWLVPLFGYGFAWVGHFFFEHNRPATFHHPLYSLIGDFALFRDLLLRRIPFDRWGVL